MRERLEYLSHKIDRIDTNNLYQAIHDIQTCLQEIVEELDKALPIDRSNDV